MSTQTEAPRSADECRTIINDLQARLEENRLATDDIPRRRSAVVLQAAHGDDKAHGELERIDEDETRLGKQRKNLEAALEEARRIAAPLFEEEERQNRKKRRAHAEGMKGQYVAASATVDDLLVQLREALDEQKKIGEELYAYQWTYDPQKARDWAQQVHSIVSVNAPSFLIHAAASAGLSDYFPHSIPRIADTDRVSLADRARQSLHLPSERFDYEDL